MDEPFVDSVFKRCLEIRAGVLQRRSSVSALRDLVQKPLQRVERQLTEFPITEGGENGFLKMPCRLPALAFPQIPDFRLQKLSHMLRNLSFRGRSGESASSRSI